jgi:uncharacterized protein
MKNVLITGATSGIGFGLAKEFAAAGNNLILIGRSEEKLRETKKTLAQYNIGITTYRFDLEKLSVKNEIMQKLEDDKLQVDVLINNAGFGDFGEFSTEDVTRLQDMQIVNMLTLTGLTRLVLPQMIARGEGKVLNVASLGAFLPGPLNAAYFATKHYVLALSESINSELEGTGVSVVALCPGNVATNFMQASNSGDSKQMKEYRTPVDEFCKIVYRDFMRGETLIIPGFMTKVIANLPRVFPRKIATKILKGILGRS